MIRRVVAGAALGVVLMAGAAGAQDSPASVLPNVVERPVQQPVEVKGVQLPRTGGDLDGEVFAGIGLTVAGAAFAVTARQRRRRFADAS